MEAVKHVKDGFTIGLGSGSTVAYAIQEIGKRVQQEELRILGVPTSHQTMMLAVHWGIPTTTLNEHPQLDLAIDGTDQFDRQLNLIKGLGGALTREKIVASATSQFVVVADQTKLAEKLGTDCVVPVEVLPFAFPTATSKMQAIGGKTILRKAKSKVGPVVTDNGNFIVDVSFGEISSPKRLDSKLQAIPGVIETGLFIEMADIVYVGTQTTVERLERE
ncbi:MAG: ribose 5-phosphate isomerase A [Candidatus Bathyarchaeota archaeon]|nr:MAG: ribose 5-phosphate isomerase A [Candidatus Bathyarchaeota archaeon]